MRKASTGMLEQGPQAPAPAPDLIPAKNQPRTNTGIGAADGGTSDPTEDILDVFHVGAAVKAETYEICEYESLIDQAREMKHSKVAQLLRQNLKEEQATLRKMEGFSKKIKPEQMMSEEQEQKERAASGKSRRTRAA